MDMTKGKEWKNVLLFTLPIVVGNLLQQLYNTVDGVVLGNFVGDAALSAVVTTQSMVFLFLSLALGLSTGIGIVVAQYFGAGRHDDIPPAIDTALILLGLSGILLTALAWVTTPFLLRHLLGVPEDIMPLAVTYFRIFSLGFPFQFMFNGIAAILRGIGDSKAMLYFLLIATGLSLVLNLLFVLVMGWGIEAVAAASAIAQAGCAVVAYIYMRKRFPYVRTGVHWNGKIAVLMTKLGAPIAIQFGIVSVGNGTMQRLVNGFEQTVPGIIAAFGVANRLDFFIFAPIMSFQAGLAGFTGQNVGAGRLDRVKRGYYATLVMSLLLTVTLSVLLYIFAVPAIGFFGLSGEALRVGVEQVRFFALVMWIFAGYITLGGLLQGAGDTVLQSAATIIALVVRIVTSYLFVHFGLLGYNAAWVTNPIGWGFATIIIYTRYFTGGWKKKAIAGDLQKGQGPRRIKGTEG